MIKILLCYLLAISSVAYTYPIPSPESVEAYKHYWNTFDQYEDRRINKSKDAISEAWDKVRQEYNLTKQTMNESQIETLREAAENYRRHLASHGDAENTPYVLLNLAQILQYLADHYQKIGNDLGTQYRAESLEVLSDLNRRYRYFEKKDIVLYLKANTLDAIDQKKSAIRTWKELSKLRKKSIYTAHANVALGDHYFHQEDARTALEKYDKAHRILTSLPNMADNYETLRVKYRIAWSSYRAAELDKCIRVSSELLKPGTAMKNLSIKGKIEQDAIELIGDALFEKNSMVMTKQTLRRKVLRNHSSGIALRILQRLQAGKLYSDIIKIGEYSIKLHPRSRNVPDILTILANAYEARSNKEGRLQSLERLSLLLPRNSLWRSQYRDEYQLIRNMEIKALAATQVLASYYYEIGMVNASISSFQTAASYYEILIKFNRNHEDSNTWHTRRAHAYYNSGKLGEARKAYENLIETRKLSQKNLQVISYQLVLSYEKIWRREYVRAAEKNLDPSIDPIVIQHLNDFENAAVNYANRFPSSKFSVESLLAVASANRDMKKFERSSKFWQRALIASPTPQQRALAIQGIIYQQIQRKDNPKLIEGVTRFLKLERWSKLGKNLEYELMGILSQAIRNYSDELNEKGKVLEAGQMMISLTNEFPRIPQNHDIYRDGVYMIAIAGEWKSALQYAVKGLDKKNFKHRGDLTYLKSRALEYQLRFKEAAQSYLKMGTQFKKHSRAVTALKKAEFIARAENDLIIASSANIALAKASRSPSMKFKYYSLASSQLSNAGEHQKSLQYGKIALRNAKKKDHILIQKLANAKSRFALGSQESALNEMKVLSKDAKKAYNRIDEKTYSQVRGESNYLVAEEHRERFNDFQITEQKNVWTHNLKDKAKLFDRMYGRYEASIRSRDPKWSSRSRYQLGNSAEKFSFEINEALVNDESISASKRDKIHQQAIRFQKLAKKFYSDNLVARNQEPKIYRNNPWVKKSIIKLTGNHNSTHFEVEDDKLPYSLSSAMPLQWSR